MTPAARSAGVRLFNTFEPVTHLYRDLIPLLAADGIRVDVYASRAEYRPGRDLASFLADIPGARLVRLPHLGLHARHGTAAKAVIGGLYFLGALARTLVDRARWRNVFLTQPPFIPTLGLVLSRLHGQPYCVILMDLQPQLATAVGLVRPRALSYRILHRLNRAALRRADRVIVIGRCMADTVREEGVMPDRIRVIPNWVDPSRIRPVPHDRNGFRRDMGWGDRFVVMYAGTLGYAQRLDSFVGAAERLAPDGRIQFVIVGEGVRRAALERRLAEGPPNVELYPFMHRRYEISEILSAADAHFVPLHPGVTGLAVPSKTYGIMACARPFIFEGSGRSEIARLAREEGAGIALAPEAAERLAEAVRSLVDDPVGARAMGERGRAVAERGWNDGGSGAAVSAVIAEMGREHDCRVARSTR